MFWKFTSKLWSNGSETWLIKFFIGFLFVIMVCVLYVKYVIIVR